MCIRDSGDEVSDLMHDFRHFGRAPADTMQLQEFHEDWVGLLEEVRFSPWCSDEGVLDQAMTAFQHYGPELRRAEREARSSGSLNVDAFLDALATEVGKVSRSLSRTQKKKKKGAGDSAAAKEQQRQQQAAADRAASRKQQPKGGKGKGAAAATGTGAGSGSGSGSGRGGTRKVCWYHNNGGCKKGSQCDMAHEGAVEVNMALQKDAMDRAVDARIEQWLKAAEAGKTQVVLNCTKAEPPVTDPPTAITNPKADPSKQSGLAGANPIPSLRRPRETLLQGGSREHVLAGLRSRFVKRGQGRECNPSRDPVPNPTKQRGTAGAGPVPGLPRPRTPLRKGEGRADVLSALQQLIVKQGKGSQGRG